MNDNPRRGLSRRLFLTAAGAGAATAALGVRPAAATAPGRGFAATFAAPPREVQAKFRWWWPHGMVEPAEIRREIDAIADAGFGGVEIADVHHSIGEPLDPAGTGWGTPPWVRALEAALDQGNRRGVIVDVTIGPAWPAAVPSITPDSDGAVKELAHGVVTVAAGETYSGPVPAAVVPPEHGVGRQDLFAVQAVRVAAGSSPDARRPRLEAASVTDLTARADGGTITWTAPGEGTWLLIAYWLRGSGQRPERGPHTEPVSFVVDHFSRAGTEAVIDFWERRILTPRVRRLLRESGGAMFEDSIEMETDTTLWTPRLPQEFESRLGYSPLPYLPVIVQHDEDPVFDFDTGVSGRVRDDVNEVLSQLYLEHHLRPLQEWLHGLGMKLRIQPYGLQTDAVAKAAAVDISEGESLGFKNLDDFRSLAGGRDMGGKKILSSEAAAVYGGSYSVTWQRAARTIGREYSAGVNQAVLHGFSYADAPGAEWPGFAAFTPYDGGVGYSESWGPRQPTWGHAADVAGHLARNQLVLQAGVARCDVAFLRQKGYAGSGFGAAWFSATGVTQGWTHAFLSPRLLELPSARVSGGRLAPDGPGYQLLVFEGDAFSGRANTMPLAAARTLLELARAGLPMLVVGPWTEPRVPGIARPGENERLAEVFGRLLAEPSVRRVDDRPQIPDGIAALGLRPDVRYAEASPLLHARRVDGEVSYFYFVNGSDSVVVDHDVVLPRAGRVLPYALDSWTGQVWRLRHVAEDGGAVRVRITLRPGESTIVALAGPGWTAGTRRGRPRGTGTAAARALPSWHLRLADWRPGASATETRVVVHERDLAELVPWSQLAGLEDVSGVGRYTTTVELGREWLGGHGACLDLGRFTDTARVWVNGRRLPPVNLFNPVVDVSGHLRAGRNTIEVEVAGTLINRLRVTRPEVYGSVRRQDCGLLGPVRLLLRARE
ncbi:alpha-L-rhamnosidase-like protein [Prauserella shujinwangii]|uniref:Alpha-L-rhamnosidase-like protein n=1 Tax=Prauserella shujinwangii TaxID=1453103 RepID=A0A2T0M3R9_9PSEU|nr:glycosyl hydrolase [Prauserella shujinwangii]PRX51398.1 alpha-L-rhamnosidase-like protein [Prauserella shujinwangii]